MHPITIAGLLTEDKKAQIPTRKLGKTEFDVPILSLGGQGSLESQGNMKNCVKIIRRAYELGVCYCDSSPIYKDSELYYGEALDGIRKKVFLASKSDDRTRDGSLKLIEKSLKRLRTDYLDLWQIHHLDNISDVNQVSRKDGALQAFVEMKEQKVVRFIGFT
jgi:aryl-alcohol dehydrogenase-like predicted oxidoreductase